MLICLFLAFLVLLYSISYPKYNEMMLICLFLAFASFGLPN